MILFCRQADAPADQINREVKILQEIETAVSQEFFKDVRKRLRRQSRKPPEKMQTPSMLRRSLNYKQSISPRAFYRRHSSVDRYLETKEMDYLPRKQLKDDDTKRYSLDGDIVDGSFLEIVDFRSHPDLSDHELEASYESPKKEKKKTLLSPPGGAKVTFSDSTYDVRNVTTPSQRQSSSGPSMLDFELDIVVDIDSGKCVLHNDNEKEENEERGNMR